MSITPPPYVPGEVVSDPRLNFKWDDWRASMDFATDAEPYWTRVAKCTLGAKTALAIGIYEWIIWRFRVLLDDNEPFQLAEAAWCANVNPAYIEYDEFDRDEWLGPVRGPIWCAMTWLSPLVCFGGSDPDEVESGFTYLVRLAFHVLPPSAEFADWLNGVLNRLAELYPDKPPDPFEDLFNENMEMRRGPIVPREVLDLRFPFDPAKAEELVQAFLRSLDYRDNPFLRGPEFLLRAENLNGPP